MVPQVQRVVQRATTSDNEWQRVTTSDKEWERVVQQVTTNDNKWTSRLIFIFVSNAISELFKPWRGPLKKAYWIKSRNKHPRRNINSKKQELQKQLFADFFSNTCFPVLESLIRKVAGLEARKSIKRRLQHRCFPVNIAKFLRTAFSIEQLWWLFLELRHFFSLWYVTLKFMKVVWHKHNLMVSFSVGSGHSGKYSYEIPYEYL